MFIKPLDDDFINLDSIAKIVIKKYQGSPPSEMWQAFIVCFDGQCYFWKAHESQQALVELIKNLLEGQQLFLRW